MEKELSRERRKQRRDRCCREEAKSELYRLLLGGRSFLEGALEPGASEALVGLEANLSQVEALVLLRYGAEADEELSREDFQPEAFVIDGKFTTPQQYATEIRHLWFGCQALHFGETTAVFALDCPVTAFAVTANGYVVAGDGTGGIRHLRFGCQALSLALALSLYLGERQTDVFVWATPMGGPRTTSWGVFIIDALLIQYLVATGERLR